MSKQLHTYVSTMEAVSYRRETRGGIRYIVAPVIMLVEGVHHGSAGPVYYPPEALQAHPYAWNGVPLPIYHPETSARHPDIIEARCVGAVYNVLFDNTNNSLRGEAWIEIEKAERLAPGLIGTIESGGRIEVSTGMWMDVDSSVGVWNGESYEGVASNFIPDHLALLPGGEGACNWQDGCGIRVHEDNINSTGGRKGVKRKIVEFIANIAGIDIKAADDDVPVKYQTLMQLLTDEMGHTAIRRQLQQLVDQLDNASWLHFVREVFSDYFIYEARTSNPNADPATKLYKRGYTVGEHDEVTIAEEAEEVREVTSYEPVGNEDSADGPDTNDDTEVKEDKVKKDELVNMLIACERTRFTEEDRGWLEELEVCRLEKLQATDTMPPPEDKEPPETNEPDIEDTTITEPTTPAEPTMEEYIANAPPEYRDTIRRSVNRDKAEKNKLVAHILKNDGCQFTEAELRDKSWEELEKIASLAKVEVDYSAQAGGPAATEIGDYQQPNVWTMEELKGKKKEAETKSA